MTTTKKPTAKKKTAKKKTTAKKAAAKKTTAPSSDAPKTTHFAIVLDSSASMQGIKSKTIETFNANVASIRDGATAHGQKATVTFATFGEYNGISVKYVGKEPRELQPLDANTYRPDGMTPLWDGVGRTVESMQRIEAGPDDAFMLVCITDGQENASRTYSAKALKALIARLSKTERWSFAFTVPPRCKRSLCSALGVPTDNVVEWEATDQGVSVVGKSISTGIDSYYVTRSTGQRSTQRFFTDMSKVSIEDVKKTLVDVKSDFKSLPVKAEAVIQPFVEDNGYDYNPGCAFYQLTKPEKIQANKEIMVRKKTGRSLYGGDSARQLLGLPDHEIRVKPGNHADWDIFVQSRSTNRKLVRGTTVLIRVK